MYHRIAPARPSLPAITRRLSVDPAAFAREIEWLASHGFRARTHAHRRPLPRKPVVITFDCGYLNILAYAAEPYDRSSCGGSASWTPPMSPGSRACSAASGLTRA
jgi:hypothetical protein